MNFNKIFIVFLGVVFLAGCSSSPRQSAKKSAQVLPKSSVHLTNDAGVRQQLLAHYARWKGTPYRFGGTSVSGVDCSAFVQNTFRSKLGYKLPRTTRTQIREGRKVSKSQLKVGDIVFFKTGRNSLHNGIYLGQSQFMHASSSKGVTLSSLNNRYWQKTYLTSRRIR